MMRLKNVYQIILYSFLLTIYSCRNNKTHNKRESFDELTISVNEKEKGNLSFHEIIDTVKIVKLETTSESLFGDITKLEILNDTIIIFDNKNQVLITFGFAWAISS